MEGVTVGDLGSLAPPNSEKVEMGFPNQCNEGSHSPLGALQHHLLPFTPPPPPSQDQFEVLTMMSCPSGAGSGKKPPPPNVESQRRMKGNIPGLTMLVDRVTGPAYTIATHDVWQGVACGMTLKKRVC